MVIDLPALSGLVVWRLSQRSGDLKNARSRLAQAAHLAGQALPHPRCQAGHDRRRSCPLAAVRTCSYLLLVAGVQKGIAEQSAFLCEARNEWRTSTSRLKGRALARCERSVRSEGVVPGSGESVLSGLA